MLNSFQNIKQKKLPTTFLSLSIISILSACQPAPSELVKSTKAEFYGTTQPFVKDAIYFVMTDRFVDGDSSNNHEDQGGEYPTFGLPIEGDNDEVAYVGYMGGDLKGVLNNGKYIADMGFSAVWLTPILDNPDEAFSGGEPITFGGAFKDGGKTGYHGYWANNFYQIDEHLPSEGLGYKEYTQQMREQFGLKSVFDIVANHGSPSFSMPVDQPKFGELYDINGVLVADHQNLPTEQLDSNNPLHDFYHKFPDILQLSNLDESNAAVKDYLINSYLYWIEQGADAFRIDTIRHVPHAFWKEMADRIRTVHPDFYMFGESFNYDANFIGQHTLAKNGGISVLDFPGQKAIVTTFENPASDYAELEKVLFLTHGPYLNPYELATFYDNHDMPRMNASDEGFIDANNWLFTARGIPVVYQGSELGFMRGKAEHMGNRNYLGQDNIELAKHHPIHNALSRIAQVRKAVPALQNGLQVNIEFTGNKAAFYRVLVKDDVTQTALVLLNKGDTAADFSISKYLQGGRWQSQLSDDTINIGARDNQLNTSVAAHGVQVWLREGKIENTDLLSQLEKLMANK
ncbi:alpha-amylase family glycosyl hydrolase [Paraglaciecola hydrolytica]|uniref:Cyclomaltodextrin glucanotransferase n=1 Tax=Paraglaciecola hydrolytica TaxID=1799789 RepID=A0A136A6E9_9ALTE|nr:alpha-amylase family glycosyl hydrolase [Paraglaciecola hydrolytica]KXI30808.1 cyclomaltodextrin glucanotransferase [Paraglaciecola hydrolytica]